MTTKIAISMFAGSLIVITSKDGLWGNNYFSFLSLPVLSETSAATIVFVIEKLKPLLILAGKILKHDYNQS